MLQIGSNHILMLSAVTLIKLRLMMPSIFFVSNVKTLLCIFVWCFKWNEFPLGWRPHERWHCMQSRLQSQ